MEQKKALIAMSGGVDSSVAAYLTQCQGYECAGATMRMFSNEILPPEQSSTCCSLDDVEDARSVAYRLGIPFHVFNATVPFRQQVMDRFARSYEAGLTPNPCVDCNRHLKFDHFLQKALLLGCSHMVTGHYARIRRDPESGRFILCKARDTAKDQSYFLACLDQEQLAHILFPLGELTKEEVRAIAAEQGFLNARKRDSQDICFIPDGDYLAFLKRYTGKAYASGSFLDLEGNVVGTHQGAVAYTLGQRKGLGLAMGTPVYVCAKDMRANTVTVGPNEALFHRTLVAGNWVWYPFPALTEPVRCMAKARSRMTEQPATVYPDTDGKARVVFDEPQRAITPGQAVVLYDGDRVIGGGTIEEVLE